MSLNCFQNADALVNHAEAILSAAHQHRHIQPLTAQQGSFGLSNAYRVTAEIRRLREARGERVIGRRVSPQWVADALGNDAPTIAAGDAWTAVLKQGATLAGAALSNLPLSGNITFTGSSCLTSGTPASSSSGLSAGLPVSTTSGAVEGNTIIAIYLMNDGSQIALEGSIAATDDSKILATLLTVQPGTCNANFVSGPITLTKK